MPAPRHIGVLTFHRCINYGSYWQARCLVDGLRARGHDAVLLDHRSSRVDRAEWRCALQPNGPQAASSQDQYRTKVRKFFDAFARLPVSQTLPLDHATEVRGYDVIMVGSDEVWNLHHPWYGGYPLFYGEGLAAGLVASYAASFGAYPAACGLDRVWSERLRRFASISVRDLNSRQLIQDGLNLEPELVLDPCLQFPPVKAHVRRLEGRYIAVYGHTFPRWFANGVRQAASALGMRLVSIGYHNKWADEQWIGAGPDEFADLVAGAAAVATNFFHGCVFSLLNCKPFACVLSDYRANKITDLVALLGAEAHLAGEHRGDVDYLAMLQRPPCEGIVDRIEALRQQSAQYIDSVLS